MTADPSHELIRTISQVLDIRRVFPRVSEIATQILPHDYLELVFQDPSGQLTVEARSADDFPAYRRLVLTREDDVQVADLRKTGLQLGHCDPPDYVERVVDAGYRSLLKWTKPRRRPDDRTALLFPAAGRLFNHPGAGRPLHRRLRGDGRVTRTPGRERTAGRGSTRPRGTARRARPGGCGRTRWGSAGHRPVGGMEERAAKGDAGGVDGDHLYLQGESGTGKEVVARFIHRASPRKSGPFVAINCAALPDQLLESELFGYERGAFTGAQQPKPGQIEMASGGVLFLDEVSEMSAAAQAKLLRVLQEREFLRLGGTRLLKANVRVIAASNRDLRDAVARGAFRQDLYYRLQVFDIQIPPLRERTRDIPMLVDAFLRDIGRAIGRAVTGLTPESTAMLMKYAWPGNVRELRNVLERAAILSDGGLIGPGHLSLHEPIAPSSTPLTDLRAVERHAIEKALQETDGNKAKTARRLGLTRTQLYVRLRKYEIEQPALS